jgi:hypothetical protein
MHEMVEHQLLSVLKEDDMLVKLIARCEQDVREGSLTPSLAAQKIFTAMPKG